jgi:hypothetical protein
MVSAVRDGIRDSEHLYRSNNPLWNMYQLFENKIQQINTKHEVKPKKKFIDEQTIQII